jgi:CRISPR-associated protein Cas2
MPPTSKAPGNDKLADQRTRCGKRQYDGIDQPIKTYMSQRDFYLAAYDISEDRRLAAALHLVRGYATGGQKSVHEVFLSTAEKDELLHEMALILDEEEDRFFLLRLDPRARSYALGIALRPADPDYFYVG